MERKYFEIDESTARRAKEMMSFYDYVPDTKTRSYRNEVNKVYDIADKVADKRPKEAERAYRVAERYSKKLANNYNTESRIGCMCPSIMISGGGNFPVRKKEKQNAAMAKNIEEYRYIQGIKEKLDGILYGKEIIKSNDEDAIEKLEEKLEDLQKKQELMKNVNAYYRKEKTLDGCPYISEETALKIEAGMKSSWRTEPKPFESYALSNNNQNIRSTKERLERLRKTKERGTTAVENEFCKVVENTEKMRIQLLFDGKPNEEIRTILKSHGFKWAPSEGAWQRQLTSNAKYATEVVLKKFEELKQ